MSASGEIHDHWIRRDAHRTSHWFVAARSSSTIASEVGAPPPDATATRWYGRLMGTRAATYLSRRRAFATAALMISSLSRS